MQTPLLVLFDGNAIVHRAYHAFQNTRPLAVGTILVFAAMPAISERVRMLSEGWLRWATGLALLGFPNEAMIGSHSVAPHPVVANVYVESSEAVRAAIAAEPLLFFNPRGWLRFGVVGLWLSIVDVFAVRVGIDPRPLGYTGIAGAFLYWTLIAGFAPSNETFLSLLLPRSEVFLPQSGASGLVHRAQHQAT